MEKPIETMWKEGFEKPRVITIPLIMNLYQQKSIHLVDKFRRDFKYNLWYVLGLGVFFLVGCLFLQVPGVGLWFLGLFLALCAVGKREMDRLKALDLGQDTYQYVHSFNNWLTRVVAMYTRMYQFFYPLLFLGAVVVLWRSPFCQEVIQEIFQKFPRAAYPWVDVPAMGISIIGIIMILLAVFGGKLYHVDMKIAYGAQMCRLKELLAELEILRQDESHAA